jgi:hypothetical protein
VRPGQELHGARIIDLAPTILSLLDVEIPGHMDGRVLDGAFQAGALAPRWGAAEGGGVDGERVQPGARVQLSEEEEAEIADRLRGLGYVG